MTLLDRVLPWRDAADDDGDDTVTRTMTLTKIKWSSDVTTEYVETTETLVWSGGAEKTITYTDSRGYGDVYYRVTPEGEEVVLEVEERPAYRVEESRETVSITQTRTRTAWVSEVPPGDGVETTGDTRVVEYEVER